MKNRKPFGEDGKDMLSEEQTICRLRYDGKACRGTIARVPVSRIEESLGHRKYECESCNSAYVFGTKKECS